MRHHIRLSGEGRRESEGSVAGRCGFIGLAIAALVLVLVVAAGGSDAVGVLVWPASSPQRPDDVRVVQLRDGVAVHRGVASDRLTVVG
jgi:hypothetical protein